MESGVSGMPIWIEVATVCGSFIVGFIVWLIRIEGKTNNNERATDKNEKAIEKLEVKHDALDSRIVDKLSSIEKSLAKIQGRLSINDEPQT